MNKVKLTEQSWGDANAALEQEKQEKQKQQQQDLEKQKQQQQEPEKQKRDLEKQKQQQDLNATGGLTARAKALKKAVLAMPEFAKDKWSAIGGYANRNVGSTDKPSEHAKGNALDWHGAAGNLDPVMKKLAVWLTMNATRFGVKNVIYNKQIWNYPAGWHKYEYEKIGGSPHTDHVHVDFIDTDKPIPQQVNQIKIHRDVQRARWDVYKVLTKEPEKYFQNFKSWFKPGAGGRVLGSDNEKAAAKWLEEAFNAEWNSKFKKWENLAHPHDQENMRTLRSVVAWAVQKILKHETGKYSTTFWNYDEETKKWKRVKRSFYWNYL